MCCGYYGPNNIVEKVKLLLQKVSSSRVVHTMEPLAHLQGFDFSWCVFQLNDVAHAR